MCHPNGQVVVDTFAEVRENDVVNLAQELEFNIEDDQKILRQIFHRIDADEDGSANRML